MTSDVTMQSIGCRVGPHNGRVLILCAGGYNMTILERHAHKVKLYTDTETCEAAVEDIQGQLYALRAQDIVVRPRVKKMLDLEGNECWVVEIYVPCYRDASTYIARMLVVTDSTVCLMTRVFYSETHAATVASEILDVLAGGNVDWANMKDVTFKW